MSNQEVEHTTMAASLAYCQGDKLNIAVHIELCVLTCLGTTQRIKLSGNTSLCPDVSHLCN